MTFGATEEEGVEFAPDGRSFVTSIGLRTSTVWVHDARGDRQITSQGFGMRPSISPDGKKLYYLMRSGGRDSYISGSLWVADLETGRQQRLVPGYLMQSYDIAADGKRVVFAAADDSTRSPLWLASLDGSTPPRRLVRSDALQAFFGVDGEVVFAGREQDKNFIYRVKEDGRELRKVVQASNVEGVSPDGKWVAVWVAGSSDDDLLNAWLVYPIDGGRPTLICGKCGPSPSFERGPWPQAVSWSRDGRFLYLDLYGSAYAIPLAPGRALPPLPAAGLRSDEEVAALPGARRIPQDKAFVGPNPSLYAFTKVSIQRNIYRVPVQ